MHRLVILGSLYENIALVKLAKKKGYYTIVCDGYKDGPAKEFADKSYNIDVRDVDKIAEMCMVEEADGIIGSYSDIVFEKITEIADRAGLKWYISPAMLKYYRDKLSEKELLSKVDGANAPGYILLNDPSDAEMIKGIKYPVVVKPVDMWGSRGVRVAYDEKELRINIESAQKISGSKSILLEELMTGCEYNSMAFVCNGKVHLLGIGDREKNTHKGKEIPIVNRIVYPARKADELWNEVLNIMQQYVELTGQSSGVICMQFFYDDKGIHPIEMVGRILGYEHELITMCSGLSIEELLLSYVYDESRIPSLLDGFHVMKDRYAAGLYFTGIQGKKIKDQSSLYSLSSRELVKDHLYFYKEGEVIDNTSEKSYYARLYVQASTREELDEECRYIFDEINILATDGTRVLPPHCMEDRR